MVKVLAFRASTRTGVWILDPKLKLGERKENELYKNEGAGKTTL